MAETTAAPPIAISVSVMNARTRFFIGRRPATAVLGVPRLAGAADKD
jgi:hypothetical protein